MFTLTLSCGNKDDNDDSGKNQGNADSNPRDSECVFDGDVYREVVISETENLKTNCVRGEFGSKEPNGETFVFKYSAEFYDKDHWASNDPDSLSFSFHYSPKMYDSELELNHIYAYDDMYDSEKHCWFSIDFKGTNFSGSHFDSLTMIQIPTKKGDTLEFDIQNLTNDFAVDPQKIIAISGRFSVKMINEPGQIVDLSKK